MPYAAELSRNNPTSYNPDIELIPDSIGLGTPQDEVL
jgi:hypothetical protein